jgi:uncharacterized membrane protein (Fun14 family)
MSDLPSFVNDLTLQLGVGVTVSAFLGLVVGYAVKKILKAFTILTGLYLASLMYLAYRGVITVHYDKVVRMAEDGVASMNSIWGYLATFAGGLPIGGSFLVGLAVGFKKG